MNHVFSNAMFNVLSQNHTGLDCLVSLYNTNTMDVATYAATFWNKSGKKTDRALVILWGLVENVFVQEPAQVDDDIYMWKNM